MEGRGAEREGRARETGRGKDKPVEIPSSQGKFSTAVGQLISCGIRPSSLCAPCAHTDLGP